MKPKLFDVKANDVSSEGVPHIKPWKRIVIDPEYVGSWTVAGDLDGDGEVEIVSARTGNEGDNHYTCSVVAHRLDGSILWRWGNPKSGINKIWHDVACQIYDWDGDGKNEVIVAAEERIVELDGTTGKEKRSFAIPPNASDCIVFANLSGAKRATDILVKTRYTQIWAFDREGKELWTNRMPSRYKTSHQPRPMDIDGDGKDEIMAGYAMLNADGTIRWSLRSKGLVSLGHGHLDCARVFHAGKTPADFRILITGCGDNFIAMIDGEGNVIWSRTGHHFESVNFGRVCPNIAGKQIIVDIAHGPRGKSQLWVLGEDGEWLGQIVTNKSRHHLAIDWFGAGFESILISSTSALFDCHGKKVAIFDGLPSYQLFFHKPVDMTGDGVPDLLFTTLPGKVVTIYKNENGKKPEGNTPFGTGVNCTMY